MSRELSIDIVGTALERANTDVVVIPLFEDERPLQGGAGRADWRLCGQLSRLVKEKRLSGAAREAALLVSFAGLRAPRLLVLGAGPREAFDAEGLATLVHDAALRAARLGLESLAFPLPNEAANRAARVCRAAAEAVAEAPDGVQLRLVLVVPGEEVLRTTDLLRRGGTRGVPGDVAVRLPSPAARRRAEAPRRPAPAPRGPGAVK